jgi:RNA polymerase sigma factor (sigma-70 family)
MRPVKYEPLTEEEKRFAEENHNLIYQFLSTKHLTPEDFYDVVAIGYCRSIKIWFSRIDQSKYKFSTIAYQCMLTDVCHYFTIKNAKKRQAHVGSLDDKPRTADVSSYYESTPDRIQGLEERTENVILIEAIEKVLTKKQKVVFDMIKLGIPKSDIGTQLGVTRQAVDHSVQLIRQKAISYEMA